MKNLKYITLILLGGTLYGTMSSFVKLAQARGYSAAEISFMQATMAAFFLGIITLTSGESRKSTFKRKDVFSLLLTGSAIGLTNFLYYQSVSYISASLAIVVLMQFTWWGLLLEWLLFKQKPSPMELVTVCFILMGTLMASGLIDAGVWSFSVKGLALVFLASLTYAAYIVANGRLSKTLHWQSKSTLIMVGSASVIFLINCKTIMFHNHFSGNFMLWALFFSVIGTTIPTALFAASIPKIGAGVSSILMTIELPVAVICANLVLDEQLSLLQIIGIVVMLTSIAAMNFHRSLKPSMQL